VCFADGVALVADDHDNVVALNDIWICHFDAFHLKI
jgi:hypothetical protein